MSKTSAVEWFFDNFKNHEIQAEHFQLYEQAKEMEKEQMFGFTNHHHVIGEKTERFFKEEFEQYYNQTYKSE